MTDQSDNDDDDLKLQISFSNSEEDNDEEESAGSGDDDLPERETGSESENDGDANQTVDKGPSEWIEFNKKVISMRPLFKSAKVQFIHKVTRTIKILRNKKGTSEQVESNNKKADRLVQEISYINRLKKDVIAKFALLHSKEEVIKIVNAADSSMEYRVKAKVASMPKISKAAEDYHSKHPEWRESLFKLIQLAGKNMKKKRRKARGKSNRSKKCNQDDRRNSKTPKNPQMLDDDIDSERFGISNFPEPPPGLENLVEKMDDKNNHDETGSDEPDDDDEDGVSDGSESEPVSQEEDHKLGISKSERKMTLPLNGRIRNVPQQSIDERKFGSSASKKAKPVKRKPNHSALTSDDDEDDEEGRDPQSKSEANIDPFFITSDNKEYKSLWKVEPADSFKNKDPKQPEFMFKNARPFKDVLSGKNKKGPSSNAKIRKVDRNEKKTVGKGRQPEVSVESLHPSWQAKKKMSVVAFQGKKVVFDDD